MQRLASGFATLWIIVFAPSLVIWVLWARISAAGIGHFRSSWHWVEDKLVFSLIIAPVTDQAWDWVDNGTTLGDTRGFLFLVATWAAMLALPPVLILFWWRVAAG